MTKLAAKAKLGAAMLERVEDIGLMDIDKLKTSWKALDEQTSELEEENRMLAREALRRRIDKTKIFFIWHNALILFCMALVLFVLPQLTPSPWLDWAVRVCGVWALYLIFRASFEFALLSKIDAAKSSVVEVCRNMSRFRKYSVGMYLVSEIIGIVALTLVMVSFRSRPLLYTHISLL